MPEKGLSQQRQEPVSKAENPTKDILFSDALNDLARVYDVTSQDDLDELVFQVTSSLQHLNREFTPSEEAVTCVRQRLERTIGLSACESSVVRDYSSDKVGQPDRRGGQVPC